jgi:hypothetical protein
MATDIPRRQFAKRSSFADRARFDPFGRPPRGKTASLSGSSVNFFRSVEQ